VPEGKTGTFYAASFEATGGDGSLVWSLAQGGLPPGLELRGVGTIVGVPNASDLLAEQSLRVPVQVGPDGILEVSFRQADPTKPGQLNGLFLVPEPGRVALLFTALALLPRRR